MYYLFMILVLPFADDTKQTIYKYIAWVFGFGALRLIERFPKFGERITVQTWACGFKAFYGDRNFTLLDEKGNRIVSANSLWIFIDTETGRPVKPDEEQLRKYGTEEKLELCRASRKIILPEGMEEQGEFSVLRHQIDTNHHVNNGQYVQMAEEFLPEGFQIRQMRAEYKKAAMLHDVIVPMACHQDGVCTVALCDEEKRPYASVEFASVI